MSDKKIALVTGSTKGIGDAIATSLENKGILVIRNGTSEFDHADYIKANIGTKEGLKKLRAVAVATIQLRYDGWVTELQKNNTGKTPTGLDNLLYSADASFSCFADLALASPADYRKKDMGSLSLIHI